MPRLDASIALLGRLVAHRGPDGYGVWTEPSGLAGFAHRRLAIIDLSEAARQPMAAPGPTVITYNGEIYNYRELRGRAVARLAVPLEFGHRMHSRRLSA